MEFILDNFYKEKDEDLEYNYGLMVPFIKVTGKMIKQKEKDD